ncbi:MAG: hypothetical protein ACJ70Z_03670 [Nitrososphaera sp.]
MPHGDNDNPTGNGDEIQEISEEDLDEMRKSFRTKRILLNTMQEEFKKHAGNARSDFERVTFKTLSKDAELIRNLSVWIETLVIENVGLKKQLDILHDIVVQLREVKENPAMMKDIDDAFKDYERSNI